MKLTDFLQHVNAELVGGKYKAVVDNAHHFVAETVDGQAVLTAVGQQIMANLPDAAITAAQVAAPVVAAAVQGFPVMPAIEQAAAPIVTAAVTQVATDAVDAILQGVKPKAKKPAA